MRKEIEALISRERERFDRASEDQSLLEHQITEARKRNQELLLRKSCHENRIQFLNEMLLAEEGEE